VNRYVIAGVLADMRAGRRVIYVARDRGRTREAFTAVAFWLHDDETAIRRPGWERVESADGKGSVRFVSVDGDMTGLSGHTVVVDADCTPRQKADILTMVDMYGEVICL
jgi:hypothetical protein